MAVNFPPYYTSQILNSNGKPVSGGLIRAYLTGTETQAPLFSPDGTPLGSSVSIDAAGNAVFCLRVGTTYRLRCIDADGAVVWTRDGVRALGETAGIENPMTGAGDMIVGAAGGEPARLAPGAEGDALKIVSGVPTWSTDEEGMQNPMTTAGDLIVGSAGGAPARLGVGTDGDILATASGAPTWEGGPKKYRNVYGNIPSPQIDDGYLGCLFYLSGSAQALTLPSSANIPSKAFIDFVFLDGTATLTITPQGTTTLNEQAAAVTIGGQAATLYRLTFLGHGGSGDEWALGGSGVGDHKVSADGTDTAGYLEDKLGAGSGISLATSAGKVVVSASTQPGDHKTAVDGADTSPDYLAAKLAAGSGISLTNTGSAVQIAADTQTGDHQLLVSATDASAGYLGAKLTAGSNITLTPQTDGDGVQTLEISATGGGGGGGDKRVDTIPYCCIEGTFNIAIRAAYELAFVPTRDIEVNRIKLQGTFPAGEYRAAIYIANALYSYSATSTILSASSSNVVIEIPTTTIPENGGCWVAVCGSVAFTVRGKGGGLSGFSRSKTIALWAWPAAPADYDTMSSSVAYIQMWKE